MSLSGNDERRRLFLQQALAMGLLGASPWLRAGPLGKLPQKLPDGRSLYSLRGDVRINGQPAVEQSLIRAGDAVSTGPGAQAIFVVGQDAFLLRENSDLQLAGKEWLLDGLRLVSGALLSVFGKSGHRIQTPTATIGIRGTGLYLESAPDLSYVCTCYGATDITGTGTAAETASVETRHHDDPKYISADGRVSDAPFINHTDDELMLIETLVGRVPPFALFDDSYGGPRRY